MMNQSESSVFKLELPARSRRGWLFNGLAGVIEKTGFERFVSAPIVLPTEEFFPGHWDQSLQAAGRLACRLVGYAGLGALGVRLSGFRGFNPHLGEGALVQGTGTHAAAWFSGIRSGVCEFGIDVRNLGDGVKLAAALAHEVAHAYRHHHALVVNDDRIEEQLTDLTAVYLGFGILVFNASHQIRTGGYSDTGDRLAYERSALGYLSPQDFALLLSAQVAVREMGKTERGAITKALSANQARLFEIGYEELAPEPDVLRHILRIPDKEAWPAPSTLVLLRRAADDVSLALVEPPTETPVAHGLDSPMAFRVAGKPIWMFASSSGLVALVFSIVSDAGTYGRLAWLGAGVLAGGLLGLRQRADTCSACGARLSLDSTCQKCGARIVATIKSRTERLEAEERYLGDRKNRRRTRSKDPDR
jgi:hypothetical protein